MPDEYVCMFWVVDNNLWLEKTSLDVFRKNMKSFHTRNVITFRQAHVQSWLNWCRKYGYDPNEKDFMYHPRGRTSYFTKTNRFELVIDPCLIKSDHVDVILEECGINRSNTKIVTQSDDQTLHYVCHKCRPDIFDKKGKVKPNAVI